MKILFKQRLRFLSLAVSVALLTLAGIWIITCRNSHQKQHRQSTKNHFSEQFLHLADYHDDLRSLPGNEDIYVQQKPDACVYSSPLVIHCVRSLVENSAHRQLIRKTWGTNALYQLVEMETVFFVGRTTSRRIQRQLQEESSRYRDVIQGHFEESSDRSLTGSLFILDWIRKHCSKARFVLLTDDNVLVNVFRFVEHLATLTDDGRPKDNVIWCQVLSGVSPQRQPDSDRFVSHKEYPWDLFPDFCTGAAHFFSTKTVVKLLNAARSVPLLQLDDVYVTGLLRNKSGVQIEPFTKRDLSFGVRHCTSSRPPELFCIVASNEHGWKLWIGLLVTELLRTAGKDKWKRRTIVEKLYDIVVQSNEDQVSNFGAH